MITILAFQNTFISAQELEPRALTNVPVGMNFIVLGYGYTQGDILLDPAIPIEDLNAKIHSVAGAYLRSIKIFGLSGKIDVIVPWASSFYKGYLTGIDTSRSLNGFGDARIRLSFNFLGAPPLKIDEFRDYIPSEISGFSIQVITPTGRYDEDKLINLGSNRWAFKPQWGFSKYLKNWIIETYLSAWFFTPNKQFFGDNELTQKPMGALKIHGIRSFQRNWWLALDIGYGFGGKTYINGVVSDSRISSFRFGLTFAVPFGLHHVLRLTGFTGKRLEKGSDFSSVVLTYQFRWIKGLPKKK